MRRALSPSKFAAVAVATALFATWQQPAAVADPLVPLEGTVTGTAADVAAAVAPQVTVVPSSVDANDDAGSLANGLASSDNPEQDIAAAAAPAPEVVDQVVAVGQGASGGLVATVGVPTYDELVAADAVPAAIARAVAMGGSGDGIAESLGLEPNAEVRVDALSGPDDAIPGLGFAVSMDTGDVATDGWARVTFDVEEFAGAYGGGFNSRLALFAFPACLLTEPERAQCSTGMPLSAVNDGSALTAVVPIDEAAFEGLQGSYQGASSSSAQTELGVALRDLALDRGFKLFEGGGGTIVAGVATASGATGNFKATDLPKVGTWGTTGSTGAFTYDLPLDAVPVSAGPVPDLTLSYNSAAIDGRSPASNGQASWVGEGWELEFGYIERLYSDCQVDLPTNQTVVGDSCWSSPFKDNYVDGTATPLGPDLYGRAAYILNLGGATHELIPSGPQTFVAKDDPSLRVTRVKLADLSGLVGQTEYFVVEMPDGSLYYFGYGADGGGVFGLGAQGATGSRLSRPIVGDDAGEPCNGVGIPYCTVGYRWMLDLAADGSGNAMILRYAQETNKVKVRGSVGADVTYGAAALPSEILYGYHGFEPKRLTPLERPEARVRFTTVDRCVELAVHMPQLLGDTTCGTLVAANAASYPDVPVDLICTATCSATTHRSASFFTTKRLASITTEVVQPNGTFRPVAEHRIIGTYPLPQEAAGSTLWLDGVYTVYPGDDTKTTDDVITYAYAFDGVKLANRVDWTTAVTKLEKRRINRITTPLGGQVNVTYRTAFTGGLGDNHHCPTEGTAPSAYAAWAAGSPVASPWLNTWDCYRVTLTSTKRGGTSNTYGIYHRYVVEAVTLHDPVGGTPDQSLTYTYKGSPGWAYEYPVLYTATEAEGGTDWAAFAGYGEVQVTNGSGPDASTTATQYFRGLDEGFAGTALNPQPAVQATVTLVGTELRGGGKPALVVDDAWYLRGLVAATRTWHGPASQVGPVPESVSWSTWKAPRTSSVTSVSPRGGSINYVFAAGQHGLTADRTPGSSTVTYTESVSTTTYDDTQLFWIPTSQTTDADILPASTNDVSCSTTEYVARRVDKEGVSIGLAPGTAFGEGSYVIAPVAGKSWFGPCTSGVQTGEWETLYDGSDSTANANLSVGLATTERVWTRPRTGDVLDKGLESKATYDSKGRMLTALTPSDVQLNAAGTKIAYDDTAGLYTRTVTNALDQSVMSWIDPATGAVFKSKDANGLYTYYEYDAAGRLKSAWAPAQLQWGGQVHEEPVGDTVPTVSFLYDMDAHGLAVRKRPVAVATAQFVGWNAAGEEINFEEYMGGSQRAYAFYDGFGRPLQQQTVAADGNGGRLVTAQTYDAFGRVEVSYDQFYDGAHAQFASGLAVAPATGDRTVYDYDWAGRTVSTTSHVGTGQPLISTTAYYGRETVSTSPTRAKTTSKVDPLGRQISLSQTAPGVTTPVVTNYAYATLPATSTTPGFSMTTVTDAQNQPTVFTSDWAGRKVSIDDPNAGVTSYGYDAGGRVTAISNPASGTIALAYDKIGRLTARDSSKGLNSASSSAKWTYDGNARAGAGGTFTAAIGALTSETSTTFIRDASGAPVAELETKKDYTFNALMQPTASKTTLPKDALLGDLSEASYESTVTYDALGRVASTTGAAFAGLPQQTSTVTYDNYGRLYALSVAGGGLRASTGLVTSTSFDQLGRPLGRTYGNGVSRTYTWDSEWNAMSEISASYGSVSSPTYVQRDKYSRDQYGRVSEVQDQALAQPMAQCYVYDWLNRLKSALATAGTCAAPEAATEAAQVLEYDVAYKYSLTGRIGTITDTLAGLTSAYKYGEPTGAASPNPPAAATSVTQTDKATEAAEPFDGTGGTGPWTGDEVITNVVAGTAVVADGVLQMTGGEAGAAGSVWSREATAVDATAGDLVVTLAQGSVPAAPDDSVTFTVVDAANPGESVTRTVTGEQLATALAANPGLPMTVTLPMAPVALAASVLPAAAVVVSVSAQTGTSEGVHGGFAVESATLSLRRVAVDTYDYDAAGRMTSRTVDSVTTTLGWDVLSNLTSTSSTSTPSDSRIFAYDASGQRVAQIVVDAVASGAVASKVTAYIGDLEVTDADVATTGVGLSATRFLTFGGATVATVTTGTPTPTWSLMLGDGQGSAQVAMKLVPQAAGTGLEPASASHTVTRNAYLPFGATRGGDNLATSRGWLGQVADTDTGLVYLNARYYDPVLARFVSPDPLMNPGDPKTLDPYQYADNNPVMMTDATGLCAKNDSGTWAYVGSVLEAPCDKSNGSQYKVKAPNAPDWKHGYSGWHNTGGHGDIPASPLYLTALDKAGLVLLDDGSTGCKNTACYDKGTNYTNALAKPMGGWGDKTAPGDFGPPGEGYIIMALLILAGCVFTGPYCLVEVGAEGAVLVVGEEVSSVVAADSVGAGTGLSSDLVALSEQNIANSGKTVIGSWEASPNYIQVAQQRGASYFDVGDAWNGMSQTERLAANNHFLDTRITAGDTVYSTVPRPDIVAGTYLDLETQYLEKNGYQWVNQWAMKPGG